MVAIVAEEVDLRAAEKSGEVRTQNVAGNQNSDDAEEHQKRRVGVELAQLR